MSTAEQSVTKEKKRPVATFQALGTMTSLVYAGRYNDELSQELFGRDPDPEFCKGIFEIGSMRKEYIRMAEAAQARGTTVGVTGKSMLELRAYVHEKMGAERLYMGESAPYLTSVAADIATDQLTTIWVGGDQLPFKTTDKAVGIVESLAHIDEQAKRWHQRGSKDTFFAPAFLSHIGALGELNARIALSNDLTEEQIAKTILRARSDAFQAAFLANPELPVNPHLGRLFASDISSAGGVGRNILIPEVDTEYLRVTAPIYHAMSATAETRKQAGGNLSLELIEDVQKSGMVDVFKYVSYFDTMAFGLPLAASFNQNELQERGYHSFPVHTKGDKNTLIIFTMSGDIDDDLQRFAGNYKVSDKPPIVIQVPVAQPAQEAPVDQAKQTAPSSTERQVLPNTAKGPRMLVNSPDGAYWIEPDGSHVPATQQDLTAYTDHYKQGHTIDTKPLFTGGKEGYYWAYPDGTRVRATDEEIQRHAPQGKNRYGHMDNQQENGRRASEETLDQIPVSRVSDRSNGQIEIPIPDRQSTQKSAPAPKPTPRPHQPERERPHEPTHQEQRRPDRQPRREPSRRDVQYQVLQRFDKLCLAYNSVTSALNQIYGGSVRNMVNNQPQHPAAKSIEPFLNLFKAEYVQVLPLLQDRQLFSPRDVLRMPSFNEEYSIQHLLSYANDMQALAKAIQASRDSFNPFPEYLGTPPWEEKGFNWFGLKNVFGRKK